MATALPLSLDGKPQNEASPPWPAAAPSSEENLRAYVQLKLELAAQVRTLREIVRKQGDKQRLARCEALMVKLAEDRFTLAVLGQFKRGKSSLMNSIIGRELLPIGVLPLTSAITVLRFGPRERLLIQRGHWAIPEELPVNRLADFVTEKSNPGNREQVSAAYVELPSMFLRRGLEFVDTPGVGSSITANTTTTYKFMPQCDAVLFVTSVEAPLNRVELEFLSDVRRHAAKMFFVVNKADLISASERDDVVDFVRRTLRDQAGIENAKVCLVSALQGLSAKLQADESLYAQSRLGDLESALADFLAHQKAEIFLRSVLDKIAQLLRGAQAENEISRRSELLPDAAAETFTETLHQQFQSQAVSRREILNRLRDEFSDKAEALVAHEMDSFWLSHQVGLSRQVNRLLAHPNWLLGRQMSQRVSVALGRLTDKAVRLHLLPRLIQSLSTPTLPLLPAWRDLCLNLRDISRVAALAHGIASTDEDNPDLLPPFRFSWQEMPLPPGPAWRPSPPMRLAWLPERCQRSRLAVFLVDDSSTWLKVYREHLQGAVRQAVDHAFGEWIDQVAVCTLDLESRMHHGLPGHRQEAIAEDHAILTSLQKHLDRLRKDIALTRDGFSWSEDYREENLPAIAKSASSERLFPPAIEPEQIAPENISEDLRVRGCAVCAHLTKVNSNFLATWQHALLTDERIQDEFARELGFCPRHQWQLEAISSPTGLSIGQAKLVQRVGRLLGRAAQKPSCDHSLQAIMPDDRSCRVCQLQAEAETRYTEQLAAFVCSAPGREAYARSQGLCLGHLDRLIAVLTDDDAIRFVLTHSAKRLDEIAEDMRSYGMKTEALRRQFRNSDEEDAYWRATILLAGSRNVCLPWPKGDEF